MDILHSIELELRFNRYIVWNDNKENIINIKGEKIK